MNDITAGGALPADTSQMFAIAFGHFFVESSRIVTERFHGDLHLFLVLVAISNNSVAHILNSEQQVEKYRSLDIPIEEDYRFTRLLPLAQIVGLPRTTVRRKVETLVELGFIEHRDGEGYRLRKRSMAKSPVIREILGLEYALLRRLFADFAKRGVIDGPRIRHAMPHTRSSRTG
jgi:hypothetical protein